MCVKQVARRAHGPCHRPAGGHRQAMTWRVGRSCGSSCGASGGSGHSCPHHKPRSTQLSSWLHCTERLQAAVLCTSGQGPLVRPPALHQALTCVPIAPDQPRGSRKRGSPGARRRCCASCRRQPLCQAAHAAAAYCSSARLDLLLGGGGRRRQAAAALTRPNSSPSSSRSRRPSPSMTLFRAAKCSRRRDPPATGHALSSSGGGRWVAASMESRRDEGRLLPLYCAQRSLLYARLGEPPSKCAAGGHTEHHRVPCANRLWHRCGHPAAIGLRSPVAPAQPAA